MFLIDWSNKLLLNLNLELHRPQNKGNLYHRKSCYLSIIFMILKKEIKGHLVEEVDLMNVKSVEDLVVKTHQVKNMNEDEINILKNNRLLVDPPIVVYILQKLRKLLIIIINLPFVFMIRDLGLILPRRR